MEHPIQTDTPHTGNPLAYDGLIIARYPGYESCFLAFHPFLKVKPEFTSKIGTSVRDNWITRELLLKGCTKLSWTEFLKLSRIKSYKSLDQTLAFYYSAYRFVDRVEYNKLIKVTEKDYKDIIPPDVSSMPLIVEKEILKFILSKGYSGIYIYTDITDKTNTSKLEDLISGEDDLPCHIRIETPDNKILIAHDFDQRFTYFLGTKEIINEFIATLDLEGFYCNEKTLGCWSYEPEENIPNKMTWGDEERKNSHLRCFDDPRV